MIDTDELDAVAAELYALPPAQFTAARNARAAQADRPLSAAIKALRKPTAAAVAVNLLVARGQLADAIELSASLREAQDDLDAAELSRLGRQRRQLVAALAAQAVSLADETGIAISASARDDVEKTINAAVVDAASAAAVLTARLISPLEAGALDDAAVATAVAGSFEGAAPAPAPAPDDLAERRVRKAAEKAAREADRAAGEAERERVRLDARRTKARERLAHLREREDEIARDLERVRAEADDAERELARRDEEHAAAAERAAASAAQAERARAALE